MDNYKKKKYIVLGSGGVKGFYILGALYQLKINEYLDDIDGYSGSSVGAIISLLMVCGYKVEEIMAMASESSIFNDFFTIEKIQEMKNNLGILSNIAVRKFLDFAVKDKIGMIPTLQELYDMTNIELYTVSYNIDKMKTVYFSYQTHPDLDCITAVLLSINIPLLFYKSIYKKCSYIDGAFCDPLPLYPFDDGNNQILCIYVKVSTNQTSNNFIEEMTYYLQQIAEASITKIRNMIISMSSDQCQFIEIITDIVNTTGINISMNDKIKMIYNGIEAAKLYSIFNKNYVAEKNENFVYKGLKDRIDRMNINDSRILSYNAKF